MESNVPKLDLAPGEIYIGGTIAPDGKTTHVILLPGDNDPAPWKAQMAWAKSIGGDLPTRVEQALLYANFKSEFKPRAYWSNEAYELESGWAWSQGFNLGSQYGTHQYDTLRARAVRRLII